jgi:nucleotide-binding universal stress UspA family protein
VRFTLTVSAQLSNGPSHGAEVTRDATTWKSALKEDNMRFAEILVPLDGSLLAEQALPKAVELIGHRPGATLILLRAVEATTLPGADPIDAQVSVVHEAEDYLESVAARLRAAGVPAVKTSVWYGSAAPSILEAARMRKPDLIMMSTHGRSGFRRLALGSVAESVLRGASIPVFLIRVDGSRPERGAREREAVNA